MDTEETEECVEPSDEFLTEFYELLGYFMDLGERVRCAGIDEPKE